MMDCSFETALDRTVRWLLEPRAIRWKRGAPPSRQRVLGHLLTIAPRIVVAAEAAEDPGMRVLARMAVNVTARIFPHVMIEVEGDDRFAVELRQTVAAIWPYRSANGVDGPLMCIGRARSSDAATYIGAERWLARVQREPFHGGPCHPAAALAAAALGAAEITKEAFRQLLAEHGGTWTADDLAQCGAISLNTFSPAGSDNPVECAHVDLGDIMVVSAGALTNGVLAVMLADPNVSARLRVLDADRLDLSNLNRYLLVHWRDALAGLYKVEHLAALASERLEIAPLKIAYEPGHARARLVLVGADRLAARHAAQADGHDAILNAASEPELVRISAHHRGSSTACLTCINPGMDGLAGQEPTIASVSALAAALHAGQLYAHALKAVPGGRVVELHPLHAARGVDSSLRTRRGDCHHCGSSQTYPPAA